LDEHGAGARAPGFGGDALDHGCAVGRRHVLKSLMRECAYTFLNPCLCPIFPVLDQLGVWRRSWCRARSSRPRAHARQRLAERSGRGLHTRGYRGGQLRGLRKAFLNCTLSSVLCPLRKAMLCLSVSSDSIRVPRPYFHRQYYSHDSEFRYRCFEGGMSAKQGATRITHIGKSVGVISLAVLSAKMVFSMER
jgi:hypothetical protein